MFFKDLEHQLKHLVCCTYQIKKMIHKGCPVPPLAPLVHVAMVSQHAHGACIVPMHTRCLVATTQLCAEARHVVLLLVGCDECTDVLFDELEDISVILANSGLDTVRFEVLRDAQRRLATLHQQTNHSQVRSTMK